MPEENKCDICGRSFDSKRGLSVHQSQAHDDEEKEETQDMTETDNSNEDVQMVNLSLKHAMVGVFVLGLAIGFSGGMLVSGPVSVQQATGTTADQPLDTGSQDTNTDSNQQETGDSQVSGSTPTEVFKNIANDIGGDASQMESCIQNSNGEASSEDRNEINQITGGLGTPTFFIGNSEIGYEQLEGAQPIGNMRPVIDEQLQEAQNPGEDTIEDSEFTLDGVTLEGEPTKGDENAPIRVIEYSDFGCPWCAEWFGVDAIPQRNIDGQQSYETLMSEYVDTGDVQFTYMDYPVSQLHPNAPQAHQAANCVLEQDEGLYWKFHDALFENRDQWMA